MNKRPIITYIAVICLLLAGTVTGRMAWFYLSVPTTNTTLTHFDTLIVLGYPCNSDGTPSPEQRERVLESVREYKSGIAPHIIMSGGAAHNQYVEAASMKRLAISQGVPPTSSSKTIRHRTPSTTSTTATRSWSRRTGTPQRSSVHPRIYPAPRSSWQTTPSRGALTPLTGLTSTTSQRSSPSTPTRSTTAGRSTSTVSPQSISLP